MRFRIDPENQLRTSNGLPSEAQEKHKPLQTQKKTFSKTAAFFFKILFKTCKKQVHKGPPCRALHLHNYRLELAFAIIRNNLSGSHVIFLLSSFFESEAYQKREDLPEPYQKPWGGVQNFSLQLQSKHPLKNK